MMIPGVAERSRLLSECAETGTEIIKGRFEPVFLCRGLGPVPLPVLLKQGQDSQGQPHWKALDSFCVS